jgi:hypothetical protein
MANGKPSDDAATRRARGAALRPRITSPGWAHGRPTLSPSCGRACRHSKYNTLSCRLNGRAALRILGQARDFINSIKKNTEYSDCNKLTSGVLLFKGNFVFGVEKQHASSTEM